MCFFLSDYFIVKEYYFI